MIPKFRVWDKKEKFMWVVAALRFYEEGNLFAIDYWGVQQYPETLDAEDVVLMQATGLQDKKGVDIYEGDIIKTGETVDWLNEDMGVIRFLDGAFFIDYHNLDTEFDYIGNISLPIEVVGNIYENPELLEGDNDDQRKFSMVIDRYYRRWGIRCWDYVFDAGCEGYGG